MPSQSSSWLVCFAATVTQEWFIGRVAQHVRSQVAACSTGILTHMTLKRFDAFMNPYVSLQVWRSIPKHSVAIWTDWYLMTYTTSTTWLPCAIASKVHLCFTVSLQLVGWLSGRTSVSDRRTFTGLHRTCSWWVTIYIGKPSAKGQPTQPFILMGSINE